MPREETNNHSTNNVFTSILLKIIFLLQVNADLVPLFALKIISPSFDTGFFSKKYLPVLQKTAFIQNRSD